MQRDIATEVEMAWAQTKGVQLLSPLDEMIVDVEPTTEVAANVPSTDAGEQTFDELLGLSVDGLEKDLTKSYGEASTAPST